MTSTPGSETDTNPVPERPEAAPDTAKPEAAAPAPESQPEPAPPAATDKEPAKRPSRLPLAAAVVAVALSGAAFVRTMQTDVPAPAMTKAEGADLQRAVSQLEARIGKPATDEALAGRVASLEKAVEGLSQRVDRPAAADPRQDDLERRVKGLEDTVGGLRGGAADLSQLSERLDTLSRSVDALKADNFTAQGLVLASGMMRMAITGDGPFETIFRTARALGASDPAITTTLDGIAPFAAKGVPTRSQLTERFAGLAGGMVRAEQAAAGGDWIDRARDTVSSLITVRRSSGDVAGSGAEAVVARTQAALRSGSLSQAIADVETLQGPAAAVAAPWLADAKARQAVEDAVHKLGQRAIERLQAALGAAEKVQ